MPDIRAGSCADPAVELTRDLVERLPTAAVYREGEQLLANAATARITGYPPEALATLDAWFERLHGARADDERRRYERVSRGASRERPETIEIVDADGEPRWLELSAAPWGQGELWVLHDVTVRHLDVVARRDAERALREAHEHFRGAFEEAPIGMAITTLDGRYLKVNAALCAITGYSASQLIGWNWLALTHPEDRPRAGDRLQAGAARRQGWRSEKRYVHADGHTLWVAVSATPVRYEGGESVGLLSMVQDITERRHLEEELRRLAQHDALTGLLNRRGFADELKRQHAHVERYGATGALLMLDLDSFKPINDRYGHAAGDKLLVAVANALRGRLRDTDLIARLGGDEFAVLLPRADAAAARCVARDLVEAVRGCSEWGAARPSTASVGIACFDGRRDETQRADVAMYEAKAAGGDRWAFSD